MAAKQVVIALDQGSSSSRALAFDARGRVVARAQRKVKTEFPQPGWVQQDPESLVRTLGLCLDDVLDSLTPRVDIIGVGLAAQRSTVILWDSQTGRARTQALSWMDGRAGSVVAAHMDKQADIHQRTGLYLTPYYSAPKIAWAFANDPGLAALAAKGRLRIGPVSTYVVWKLTQGAVFTVDPAMAQRMLLFNIQTGDWDEELLKLFAVPRESLPSVVPSTGEMGMFKRKGRALHLRAVLGDQQSAAYGQGGSAAGTGVLNYGTGAFFLLHTGEELHHIPGILTSVAWQKNGGACSYFLEGTVHAAGTSFDWLRENLGLLQDMKNVDSACRSSTHRILTLQTLGGLGAPRWDYKTPTAMMGIEAKTRPEDIVRSMTESLGFLVSDIVHAIQAGGLKIRNLKASGGLARIDYLLQFQSDLLRQSILRLKEREATALGAASMAAEAAGASWGPGLCGGKAEQEFRPGMPQEDAERLLKGWRLFVAGQQKLAGELRDLGLLCR